VSNNDAPNLHASFTWLDASDPDNTVCIGQQPPEETRFTTAGALYRDCVEEYGRPVSSVYVDTKSRGTLRVGWVFRQRVPYEDEPRKTFLRETWVTVYEENPAYAHGFEPEFRHHNLSPR